MNIDLLIKEIDANIENGNVLRENFRRIRAYLMSIAGKADAGEAAWDDLEAHKHNYSNPHHVTAAQVGSPSSFNKTDHFDVSVDGQTVFTLTSAPSTPETTSMIVNSCEMQYGTHFTVSGTTLTFNPAAAGFLLEHSNEFGQPDHIIVHYME